MSRTRDPDSASVAARFSEVTDLPSPEVALVSRMILGGAAGVENRTAVRRLRNASEITEVGSWRTITARADGRFAVAAPPAAGTGAAGAASPPPIAARRAAERR